MLQPVPKFDHHPIFWKRKKKSIFHSPYIFLKLTSRTCFAINKT